MIKFIMFVGLMFSLTSMLLHAAEYVPRGTLDCSQCDISRSDEEYWGPVDFENTGADIEYIHGSHCIDGRSF